MKNTYLSRFTPSLMTPEALEAILVQRQQLVQDLVERLRESAANSAQHYTLLIGPRGIGKTYLISLIYHRVCKLEDLRQKLVIAWLREEEWGVSSFLDLLMRIFHALENEYLEEYNAKLRETVEELYQSPDTAENRAAELLKEFVGNRTLLLLVENLDEIFAGLGEQGQKQFRAFIQELARCRIVATSTSLFKEIKNKKSPFYEFFKIEPLTELTSEEAAQLLKNIAEFEGKQELAAFIDTKKGFDRIKVVHYLSGGSPRIYIIFSVFLTRESLNELIKAFMEMLDDLTPLYQERMKNVSNQQRKIVDFLCTRGGAAPVKEIAKRCFLDQRTVSSQLKDLRDKSYVKTEEIGRESWYELREPLMRFCLEVKKQRNQPIRLIVDFIRVWYTRQELQQRLGLRMADVDFADKESHFMYRQNLELIPPDAVMEREYYTRALEAIERNEEDPRLKAFFDHMEYCIGQKNYVSALASAEKLVKYRGDSRDWSNKGFCLNRLECFDEALECLDQAIELDSNNHWAWVNRGIVLDNLKRYEEALVSLDRVIELDPFDPWAWTNKGGLLNHFKRYEEALISCNKALKIDANYQWAWAKQGNVLNNLKRYEEALVSLDRALKIDANNQWAWGEKGNVLNNLKRYEEALVSLDLAIELDANYQWAWVKRGEVLCNLKRYDEALSSLDRASKLDANNQWAWVVRASVLYYLKRYDEFLVSCQKVLALDSNDQFAWLLQDDVLKNLKRYEETLASYDQVIELDANNLWAWLGRGFLLNNLKRYDEALASFDRAIKLDANNPWGLVSRGYVFYNLKRYDEALASFDRAIKLDANNPWGLVSRGYAFYNLKRYDEALASFDRAIELDANFQLTWVLRGLVLNNLKRYDEALASLDRVIALGSHYSSVFFYRAIAILGLNRWDEGIAALDDAFQRLEPGDEADAEDAELIIRHLFLNTHDLALSQTRITRLIAVYKKHKYLSILAKGIVRNIPALMSEMVSDKAARTWLELWQELTSNYEQFQIPIRLLDAAVRYKETKGERRVLLELAIEERNLLEPLVSTKPE